MAIEHSHSPEVDLDKTDRLPILDSTMFDQEVEDNAAASDHTHTAVLPDLSLAAISSTPGDFVRPSGVDLPSLAESVRSVEERIARQNAEYEALNRAYERSRDAELASVARANALAADLASARTALATHDATIVQVLQSLGERDQQLAVLQAEHAKILPALEATSKSSTQLEADLQATRARANALASDLKVSQETAAELNAQLERGGSELGAVRSELSTMKTQADSYLERLRTREWRNGFDQNMFREMDAQVGAAYAGQSALESERDRLQGQVADLKAQLQSEVADLKAQLETQVAGLEAKRESQVASLEAKRDSQLASLEMQRAGQVARLETQREKQVAKLEAQRLAELAAAETERVRLSSELAARDLALAEALEQGRADARMVEELLEAADLRQAEHATQLAQLRGEQSAQIARLQTEAEAREQEMAVLMAHLQEARRPIQLIEAEAKRLTEELAAKSAAFDELHAESGKLRATLERTRGALEEREFLIRRLERSESNNANVLGRIQTSIERLGSSPVNSAVGVATGVSPDWAAELIRIDGGQSVTYALSRRTRIGRANGCELQIDSSSVSRHHALVVVGAREAVIEDLNSTNGVLVNGRKVTRQPLADGDAVTIGEVQFRYMARPLQRLLEPSHAEPPTPT